VDRLRNYINGERVDPVDGGYSEIINPATGTAYVLAPLSGPSDVDAACRAAAAAFPVWSRMSPGARSRALHLAADALEAKVDELVEAEVTNTGRPRALFRDEEFPTLIEHFRFFASAARDLRGLAAGSYLPGYDSVVRREPIGVCAQVSPWNYPLNMGIWKLGPALAAGNTVVLKPSDTTPVSTCIAASVIGDLLPPGALNVIIGDRDTGRALVAHPTPRLVSVTGSVRAGKEVSAAASSDLKRVHLELGGKAPILVFDDIDPTFAAEGVAAGGFLNAGQDCEAATRVLVQDGVYDAFVEALVKVAQNTRYGAPDDEDITYGALNSEAHLDKVQGYIDRLPEHATVHTGGKPDRRDGGYYYPPTIVTGVRQDDEIVQQEVFGPVITVQRFSDEAEAIRMANDVDFGLAAGIWSYDHAVITRVSGQLDFGKVWVNCHLVVAPEMPNNGRKQSGHGNDMSVLAIEEYTQLKHVMSAIPDAE
jgi:betaine-aldehyde dehydrogenase